MKRIAALVIVALLLALPLGGMAFGATETVEVTVTADSLITETATDHKVMVISAIAYERWLDGVCVMSSFKCEGMGAAALTSTLSKDRYMWGSVPIAGFYDDMGNDDPSDDRDTDGCYFTFYYNTTDPFSVTVTWTDGTSTQYNFTFDASVELPDDFTEWRTEENTYSDDPNVLHYYSYFTHVVNNTLTISGESASNKGLIAYYPSFVPDETGHHEICFKYAIPCDIASSDSIVVDEDIAFESMKANGRYVICEGAEGDTFGPQWCSFFYKVEPSITDYSMTFRWNETSSDTYRIKIGQNVEFEEKYATIVYRTNGGTFTQRVPYSVYESGGTATLWTLDELKANLPPWGSWYYDTDTNTKYTLISLADGGDERFETTEVVPGSEITMGTEGVVIQVTNDDYDDEYREENDYNFFDVYLFRFARDFGDYTQHLIPMQIMFCVGSRIDFSPEPISNKNASSSGIVRLGAVKPLAASDALTAEQLQPTRTFIDFSPAPSRGDTVSVMIANRYGPFEPSATVTINGSSLPASRYVNNGTNIEIKDIELPASGDLIISAGDMEFYYDFPSVNVPQTDDNGYLTPLFIAMFTLLLLGITVLIPKARKK